MPHASCPMPHAPCLMPHAPCLMPHAPSLIPIPHASCPCPMPHASCPTPDPWHMTCRHIPPVSRRGVQLRVWPGSPYPLGATFDGIGTNFSVFSEVANRVELCLFDDAGNESKVDL